MHGLPRHSDPGRWLEQDHLSEMAEHVGVRHFSSFLRQVHDMLNDNGVFFLQIAGLRKCWQYEDLVWGLFMNKYIFPGADASTPLGWFVDSLEGAGFEVKGIDTIGVHYSATIWRWYRNWIANKEKVVGKYGQRWYRVSLLPQSVYRLFTLDADNDSQIWEFFLAWSTIVSRQGSATCYQITLVKNINSTHRVEGVPSQFNLKGAFEASKGCWEVLISWNEVEKYHGLAFQKHVYSMCNGRILFINLRSYVTWM